MRHWLTILLLMFLPLQASWAAVAGYCQHETGVASQHIGHHQHEHGLANETGPERMEPASGIFNASADPDCGPCHASFASILIACVPLAFVNAATDLSIESSALHSSAPRALPERPNWSRLA